MCTVNGLYVQFSNDSNKKQDFIYFTKNRSSDPTPQILLGSVFSHKVHPLKTFTGLLFNKVSHYFYYLVGQRSLTSWWPQPDLGAKFTLPVSVCFSQQRGAFNYMPMFSAERNLSFDTTHPCTWLQPKQTQTVLLAI